MKPLQQLLLPVLLLGPGSLCHAQIEGKAQSNGYEYIDLGLPSGTKWAACNVGTDLAWKGGRYFAWGEVAPKDTFTWETYKHCEGSAMDLKKYNAMPGKGTTDTLSALLPEDDAATIQWGNAWCTPTIEQFRELQAGCNWSWTPNYNNTGLAGNVGQSKKNGNTIFFPAVGYVGTGKTYSYGDYGDYWTSTLDVEDCGYALDFSFVSGSFSSFGNSRYIGQSVRPVLKEK